MSELIMREGTEFVNLNDVLTFLGAERCRLVYRINRKKNIERHGERAAERGKGSSLFILDYDRSRKNPTVYEYPDEPQFKSFAPKLSPDGSTIVYCHSYAATDIQILPVGGESPVKIATGANPQWCQDETNGNLYIVYRDRNDKFLSVPQDGITYRLRIDSNYKPSGEPEVIAAYSFGGGMSTNGRYLCSAHALVYSMDRQTGAISAPLGTVYCGPERTNQCCCPSMAPDATGRMMVLRWPHDRFSVMGWDGSELTHYPMPAGAGEWQTPEWSTHPNFATGSIMNKELIYDVVLVNLSTKESLRVTSDGGYIHAHLWVG